ncbi:hypothetical protein DICVIV_04563 [Dictyocaulus viviparus]|uniref:CCZ1/INTU/HSP4 first Longin domain-containing protein n=1 Tax=Dictyocaulus viviparus TaxID=29172 RepID=A0A0D8XZV9_DICVI|nr:hypothetical protein DICVIV_04563 [Dictyocaulus viviparus]
MPSGPFINPMYIIAPTPPNEDEVDMWIRLPDILDFFFVAHPPSGRREGEEHERIMYFYPKEESLDRQTELTGFAEAVVNFTDNFSDPKSRKKKPEYPHRTVSTQKTEHVYIQVENCEFLIGLSLSKIQCTAVDYFIFTPTIQNVLVDVYKMFRLFFGDFSSFRKNDQQKFKERLEYFFGRYLPLMKLHKMPILDYLSGAAYLRLDGPTYLNVVTMSSEFIDEFPDIQKLLVLYQDKLLYYTVSRRDIPSIFRYLTQSLLPLTIGDELEHQSGSPHGRFLRGPSDLDEDTPLVGSDALPTVYLHGCDEEEEDNKELVKHHMMVYRSSNATLCMFTDQEVTRQIMRNIDAYLQVELYTVATEIGDSISKEDLSEPTVLDFHYIYFNPASLSLNSSFTDCSATKKPSFPPIEIVKMLCTSMQSFFLDSEDFGECSTKSDDDWWIVLKKVFLFVNARLLCLLIPPSTSQHSLADVQARTAAIVKTHFEDIFFT